MTLARVVTFEGVPQERIDAVRGELSGDPPEGVPATEFVLLYDADAQRSVAIMFFDNEADYEQGDATLNAIPAGDTPGRRTSVDRYDVAARATA